MKLNIQKLIKELMSYTPKNSHGIKIVTSNILSLMEDEFKRLEASNDAHKQSKMIELFMGGMIYAQLEFFGFEDIRTKKPEELSPERRKMFVEGMYNTGKQTLKNLPKSFNGYKINNPPLFPALKLNAHKIDLLVDFCIKNSNDLERPVMTYEEPLSGIDMQIIGGFAAVIGLCAVAVAVVLIGASFGIAGLIFGGIGAAAILGGLGFFATGTYKRCQEQVNDSIDNFLPSSSL